MGGFLICEHHSICIFVFDSTSTSGKTGFLADFYFIAYSIKRWMIAAS
jgi:prolipoprotein diacylglyceryltransferase